MDGAWMVGDNIPFYDLPKAGPEVISQRKADLVRKLKEHGFCEPAYRLEYREGKTEDGTLLMAYYAFKADQEA